MPAGTQAGFGHTSAHHNAHQQAGKLWHPHGALCISTPRYLTPVSTQAGFRAPGPITLLIREPDWAPRALTLLVSEPDWAPGPSHRSSASQIHPKLITAYSDPAPTGARNSPKHRIPWPVKTKALSHTGSHKDSHTGSLMTATQAHRMTATQAHALFGLRALCSP